MHKIIHVATTTAVILVVVAATTITSAFAVSPYQSGFRHGVSDAKGGDYIVTPGKGFAFHTHAFNQGFIDGWCSVDGPSASSDADEATFDCSERSK